MSARRSGTQGKEPEGGHAALPELPEGYSYTPKQYVMAPWGLEHRLIAQTKVGRPLHPDDEVDHDNGVAWDNRPENIIVRTKAAHLAKHGKRLHDEDEADPFWMPLPGKRGRRESPDTESMRGEDTEARGIQRPPRRRSPTMPGVRPNCARI